MNKSSLSKNLGLLPYLINLQYAVHCFFPTHLSKSRILDYQARKLKQIGTVGEYTAHFPYIYGSQEIPSLNY
ncbi:hypothetical protein Cylst_6103 [Cylindrospermum stagnale PCC 7417]|uniref:Uncharacterized protein n=1 Tax=Cylindrospermum stagnale PCC 7417 TaxID=56107 RepID=K9X7K4_9NOST|nr:hypothetical protein [Cylindrospermum stagnale]AFZ28074.1 hypothetical protein Cylst_6103 [Cylindrospermum stagnale PCC 7417]